MAGGAGPAHGLDLRFGDWLDNADVLRLMRARPCCCSPRPGTSRLSRVLLEGCAVGATILALDTGGTPDIIDDGVNGRLVADMDAFAAGLRDLLDHPLARARWPRARGPTAERRFGADVGRCARRAKQIVPERAYASGAPGPRRLPAARLRRHGARGDCLDTRHAGSGA